MPTWLLSAPSWLHPAISKRSFSSRDQTEEMNMIKRLVIGGMAATGIAAMMSGVSSAQPAGEWTKCVAWSGGLTWNIVNGYPDAQRCFALGRACTGNPNAQVTYYNPAVVVNAPYQRCAR
jgi:hypothetical protein